MFHRVHAWIIRADKSLSRGIDKLTTCPHNQFMESALTYQDFDSYEEYLEYIETEAELAEQELEPEIG